MRFHSISKELLTSSVENHPKADQYFICRKIYINPICCIGTAFVFFMGIRLDQYTLSLLQIKTLCRSTSSEEFDLINADKKDPLESLCINA